MTTAEPSEGGATSRVRRGRRARGRHIWERQRSLALRLALSPLVPLAWFYAFGARAHRWLYRAGWLRSVRLPVKVISVGNLSVGGSAKTPVAAWLARGLQARGVRVALLSRGVGGAQGSRVNVVSDGARIWLGPAEVGDEPVWLAHAVPGVPVLAGVNRAALGLRAGSALGVEVVILDDGFQHHRVARDVDLVCLEASLGLGNRWTLPYGPLREPARALRHADAILVTRAQHSGATAADSDLDGSSGGLGRRLRSTRRFYFGSTATALRPLGGGATEAVESLRGGDVGVLTAIARPDRLCRDVEALGARVVELCAFPDHHLYRRQDLDRLDRELRWITTAKDAVKLPPEWAAGRSIHVLEETLRELDAASPDGQTQSLVDWVLDRLDPGGRGCEGCASESSGSPIDSEAP